MALDDASLESGKTDECVYSPEFHEMPHSTRSHPKGKDGLLRDGDELAMAQAHLS